MNVLNGINNFRQQRVDIPTREMDFYLESLEACNFNIERLPEDD